MEIAPEKLDSLLKQLEEHKTNEAILKKAAISIMTLMGLIEPGSEKMKPEIASGEESFIPGMLKSLLDVVSLLTKSQGPKWLGGEKAKEELATKFEFIKDLLPLINKHGA